MVKCQCKTSHDAQCQNEASQHAGTNLIFCWKHQNCQNPIPLFSFSTSIPPPKIIDNLITRIQQTSDSYDDQFKNRAPHLVTEHLQVIVNNAKSSQLYEGNLMPNVPQTDSPLNIKKTIEKANKFLPNAYTVDSFKTLKILGEGAFGQVYSARNKKTGKTLVIKKIPKAKTKRELVDREINVLNYLKPYCHQYILCYEDSFEDEDNTYLITEYLGDFVPLTNLIEKVNKTLSATRLLKIVANLILGLRSIHKLKVAHRDIKPDNILVSTTGSEIKYIDFGLACFQEGCSLKSISGTPVYMAPELYLRKKSQYELQDLQKTDIWSLGITLWHLLVGRIPFHHWVRPTLTLMSALNESEYEYLVSLPINKRIDFLLKSFFIHHEFFTGTTKDIDIMADKAVQTASFYMLPETPASLKDMLQQDPSKRKL